MVQSSQESGHKYFATCSSIHSFARTAHSLTGSAQLASLARSTAFNRSLARSLTQSQACWKKYDSMSENVLFCPTVGGKEAGLASGRKRMIKCAAQNGKERKYVVI